MAHRSDPTLLTLHALRLKGYAEPAEIAEFHRLDESEVRAAISEAELLGHVAYRDGRLSGFHLTPEGREHVGHLLAVELAETEARPGVEAAHASFVELNHGLLRVCTRWQLRDDRGAAEVNDHSDRDYDGSVLAQLRDIHAAAGPVLTDLGALLDRFAGHGRRLSVAFDRLTGGEPDFFTRPRFPSYHSIWFELHEDLLVTLGIDRASEGTH